MNPHSGWKSALALPVIKRSGNYCKCRIPRSGVTSDPWPSVLHGIVQSIGSNTHAQTL